MDLIPEISQRKVISCVQENGNTATFSGEKKSGEAKSYFTLSTLDPYLKRVYLLDYCLPPQPTYTMKEKAELKKTLLHFGNRDNVDLISVEDRLIFLYNERSRSYYAKLKLINRSPRFVSFKISTSNAEKFLLFHDFGFIAPNLSVEVIVSTTRKVDAFPDIAKESFCVFAVPIYDKRQVNQRSLSVLWKAHGSELFPFDSTECHSIPHVIPKNDQYYDDVSIMDRLSLMSHLNHTLFSTHKRVMKKQELDSPSIDEETFLLSWPTYDSGDYDASVNDIVKDCQALTLKALRQSQDVQENAKLLLATSLVAFTTLSGLGFLYSLGSIDLLGDNDPTEAESYSNDYDENEKEGIFSTIKSWYNAAISAAYGWIRSDYFEENV